MGKGMRAALLAALALCTVVLVAPRASAMPVAGLAPAIEKEVSDTAIQRARWWWGGPFFGFGYPYWGYPYYYHPYWGWHRHYYYYHRPWGWHRRWHRW